MLEYSVPIESHAELNGDFTINGIAINETVTSNGHKFIGEELSKSASTLIGVPLLKDHDNSVDSIVGKVRVAHWDESLSNIPFTAVVKDPKMIKLIKDGLLSSVSVGADVNPEDIEELENGDVIPHNITFRELSLVAVGADSGATISPSSFSNAFNEAYKLYSTKVENSTKTERGDNMTEEEKKTESTESTETTEEVKEEESKEESKEETKEESKEEVSEEEKEIDEKIKKLEIKAKKNKLAKLLEADADEGEKETDKAEEEESKEEESEEEDEVEEKGNYKITSKYNSVGIERKSYVYN